MQVVEQISFTLIIVTSILIFTLHLLRKYNRENQTTGVVISTAHQ